jgi:hypothetical protein
MLPEGLTHQTHPPQAVAPQARPEWTCCTAYPLTAVGGTNGNLAGRIDGNAQLDHDGAQDGHVIS